MRSHTKKRRFRLTKGDLEIFTDLYQLRVATNHHLIALTGRTQRKLNGRLEKLAKQKYLYRRRSSPYERYIYTLNKRAAPLLVERGIAPKEMIDMRVRLGELTDLFLKHTLMLTDIHTTLMLASKVSPIKLIDWREGKAEVYDSVILLEEGERVKYPERPDAFFTLQDTRRREGENKAHFFLEADRSTTTNSRFQRKIKGYESYYRQGLHTKKYGIQGFRVITLTITEARAINLCEAAREVLPKGEGQFYLFATVKHLTFENTEQVFEEIFITPHDYQEGKRYSLIPPLAK